MPAVRGMHHPAHFGRALTPAVEAAVPDEIAVMIGTEGVGVLVAAGGEVQGELEIQASLSVAERSKGRHARTLGLAQAGRCDDLVLVRHSRHARDNSC